MKFLTFTVDGEQSWGTTDGKGVTDLADLFTDGHVIMMRLGGRKGFKHIFTRFQADGFERVFADMSTRDFDLNDGHS